MKLILLIVAISLLTGCNDNQESEPFDGLLSNQPYAPLTDSIKKDASRDDLYFRRAILLNKDDHQVPALADFRKAWSLKKEENYAFGISNILLELKPDSAQLFLQEAIKQIPTSNILRITLARSYMAQEKTDEALQLTNELLQANPNQVDVLKMKAYLLEKKGNMPESINLLETAYAFTPYDVELNYVLALKYAESRNQKVLALMDSLEKQDSLKIHAEPFYYKGIYYSNIKDNVRAIFYFDQAIKRDYNFLDAYIEKGSILYDEKKYNDALNVFNLVMNISPKYPPSYYWIAKSQEALGKKAEAKLNYQRAYGLDNTMVEAKAAAEKL